MIELTLFLCVAVSGSASLVDICEAACKKLGVAFSLKKSCLYDERGNMALTSSLSFIEGQRVVVAHDGKPFVSIQLKQSAAERRAAKLQRSGVTVAPPSAAHAHGVLASMAKLPLGVSEIIAGLYLGSCMCLLTCVSVYVCVLSDVR